MYICANCFNPTAECCCSSEKKEHWQESFDIKNKYELKRFQIEFDKLSDDSKLTDEQAERKKFLLERYERLKAYIQNTTYETYHSIEIDDDFVDVITSLWKKGYKTQFCCSGHPEKKDYSMYVVFLNNYYFDFTSFKGDSDWQYYKCNLNYRMKLKNQKQLKKTNTDIDSYFYEQRKVFKEWIFDLPQARELRKGETIKGVGKRGVIIK